MRLIRSMSDDIEATLEQRYSKAEPQIATDSPLADLKTSMNQLARKWQDKFDAVAAPTAKRFVKATESHATRTAMARMKAAGMIVEFKPTVRQQQIISAAVTENTKLIKSIASEYLDDVAGIVNRGVMAGRDRHQIVTDLRARYGITQRRAALIARQECRNATVALNKARDLDLGIEEGIWVHSGGGKHPRPEHVKAGRERLRFKLSQGAYIDGEWIMPGEQINCSCSYRPVLKGWND